MMNDKSKRFPLFVFANLVLVIFLGAAGTDTQASVTGPLLDESTAGKNLMADGTETESESVQPLELSFPTREAEAPAAPVVAPNPWVNYPNVCETFNMIQSPKRVKDKKGKWRYPVNYKRNRYKRPYQDRRRTRKLVEFVAAEMEVPNPEFFAMFAIHESTWNPETIHILNPDLQANARAWERHSYDVEKEKELEEKLANGNARTKEYWKWKAQLADITLYKGNQHWNDRLAYDYIIPEHTTKVDGEEVVMPEQVMSQSRNVWGFGYGLYGMYAVGYVKVWDKEAPPWILCGEEGIIATVIQVWAARNAAAECNHLTDKNPEKWGQVGGTYEGTVRRLARGHCSDKRLGKVWQRLMKEYNTVPWDASADFGTKWPQYEMKKRRGKWVYKKDANGKKIPTDREAILAHMVEKARKKGLLRETPLELHNPNRGPVVVAFSSEVGGGGGTGTGTGSSSAAP